MRLAGKEVENIDQLRAVVQRDPTISPNYKVAVEALIFNDKLEWILMHRGASARDEIDKLEGIGGRFEGDEDFRSALRREIDEEVGTDAVISIVSFLEVKKDR